MNQQKRIKISWSAYDRWKKCPYLYKLYHIDKSGYDLDRKQNRVRAVQGSVIQEFISRFINDRYDDSKIKFLIENHLIKIWNFAIRGMTLNWEESEVTEKELYNKIKNDLIEIIKFIQKEFTLTGENYRSEISLTKKIENNFYLTGRLDFLFKKDNKIYLLDGKATKDVDIEQLYFYAFLYKKIFNKYPHKIGYIFYLEKELQFYDVDENLMLEFEKKLSIFFNDIRNNTFNPKPEEQKCSFCLFKNSCEFKEKINAPEKDA